MGCRRLVINQLEPPRKVPARALQQAACSPIFTRR